MSKKDNKKEDNIAKFKIGDIVALRSGGPPLNVFDVVVEYEEGEYGTKSKGEKEEPRAVKGITVWVVWFNENNESQEAEFDQRC